LTVPIAYVVIILLVVFAGAYSAHKKRSQIFCWFEGEDGTNEHRWVKDTDGWVIFRRYKFKIMPERMSNMWVKTGIHWLFPTRASCLSFTWYSQYPRDPKNFGRTLISPQVRKIINKSDLMESYVKTSSPGSSKRETFLSRYGVIIAIVLVAIVGIYLYTNMQGMMSVINAMQQQINTIAR
jgi:hypothetical protein